LVVLLRLFFTLDVLLELRYLFFVFFYDFLAKVRSLSQLFFDLLMVLQVPFQCLYNTSHLVIFIHLVLCLFRLILKLTGKTGILNNSKFCSAHKLIFIHVQHFYFYSSDLKKHVFSEFVDLNDFIMFYFFNFLLMSLPLLIPFPHPVVPFIYKYCLVFFKLQVVIYFIVEFPDLIIKITQLFLLFILYIFCFRR
jgi:hypothetical protein